MDEQGMTVAELSIATGVEEQDIRSNISAGHLDPILIETKKRKGKRRKISFDRDTAPRWLNAFEALYEIGFEREEAKEILQKIKSLDVLKEKINELPYPELLKYLEGLKVKLERRDFFRLKF